MSDFFSHVLVSPEADALRYALEIGMLLLLASFVTFAAWRNHVVGRTRPALWALAAFLWPLLIRQIPRLWLQLALVTGIPAPKALLDWWGFGIVDWLWLAGTVALFFTVVLAYPDIQRPQDDLEPRREGTD